MFSLPSIHYHTRLNEMTGKFMCSSRSQQFYFGKLQTTNDTRRRVIFAVNLVILHGIILKHVMRIREVLYVENLIIK